MTLLKGIGLKGMEKRVSKKEATERKSPTAKARANVVKFCQILDDLPINFGFTLSNVSKGYDGYWVKISSDVTTAWHNGSRVLLDSSFFPIRRQVLEAIEREGRPVKQLYFPETKRKVAPLLSKEEVKELYYEQKKSLQEIAKERGCTRQWIFLLMEGYGLKRRTRSEATKEAALKNKIPLIRSKR